MSVKLQHHQQQEHHDFPVQLQQQQQQQPFIEQVWVRETVPQRNVVHSVRPSAPYGEDEEKVVLRYQSYPSASQDYTPQSLHIMKDKAHQDFQQAYGKSGFTSLVRKASL